jgi:hypothetical protein
VVVCDPPLVDAFPEPVAVCVTVAELTTADVVEEPPVESAGCEPVAPPQPASSSAAVVRPAARARTPLTPARSLR